MKKLLLPMVLLFTLHHIQAQQTSHQSLVAAKRMLDKNSKFYNPKNAFSNFLAAANNGNAEAMNVVGMLYNQGLGIELDGFEAMKWFRKSSKLNYPSAFHNLGLFYKNGYLVKQDYSEAFKYFEQCAKLKSAVGYYDVGYMLFKGLGCKQSYILAKDNFLHGALLKQPGCMYMLGICYRNGYGVTANNDSAHYWLDLSSKRGYKQATEELTSARPENPNINHSVEVKYPSSKYEHINLKSGYKKVKHNILENEISGEYIGYAIKFDWSGKYIIDQTSLKVTLKNENANITGQWIENETLVTSIAGKFTDTSIVFSNVNYNLPDHYNRNENTVEFKEANLNFDKSADTIFVSGNLNLFSAKNHEPEKPTFLMLIKSKKQSEQKLEKVAVPNRYQVDSNLVKFLPYPNPFIDKCQLDFSIKKASSIRIFITSVQTGAIVYKSNQEILAAGEYTRLLNLNNISTGIYILNLYCGDTLKSCMIYKN